MPIDFRTAPSQSPEGSERAKAAWEQFYFVTALELTGEVGALCARRPAGDVLPEVRDALVSEVIEESELLGFWLAWRRAGGFAGREAAGWNRATVFRKVRRFRTTYGIHPDDYQPDWIDLDLPKVWSRSLRRRLEHDADR